MSLKKLLIIAGALLVLAAIVVACGPKTTTTPAPTEPTEETVPVSSVPFQAAWSGSGHADGTAEAFNHWNDTTADPTGVPAACAKCHTSTGIVNFLNGAPVDIAAPGGVIVCTTCHNDATVALTSVTFPGTADVPGVTITGLGPEARCMTCHQGRESKITVDAAIAGMENDTVSADLGFKNIHYFAAAATQYGGQVKSGYQYDDGQIYDAKFQHTEGLATCTACHDQHTLEIKIDTCKNCHENVATVEDLKNARMAGSEEDYNGNGDTTEGIYYEIQGLQEMTLKAIQAYAADVNNAPIAYSPDSYPYFFADANANGVKDEGETKYVSWTPRLLMAAYNFQLSIKDPGAFAHNGKYVIELLYDSITDLNTKLPTPIDLSNAHRDDAGHFAGDTMPFRYWDEAGMVPASCSKCHSATGLPQFISNNGSLFITSTGTLQITGIVANPSANGFLCSTCHDEANWPNRYAVASVTFPSGAVVSFGGKDADGKWVADDANLCIACHQGRESTASLDKYLAGKDPTTVSDKISFKNVHYFAAGATLFGNDVKGAYQFAGKTYLGKNMHPADGSFATCTACHDTHTQSVKVETCATCHTGVTDPGTIRSPMDTTDWDGDGNVTEPIEEEIATLQEALYAQIQAVGTANGMPIAYSAAAYPYFFSDTNGNGTADADEAVRANAYKGWSPILLEAAYNYQYSIKDPGAFAHNPKYIIQILVDSIEAIGGNFDTYTRP
ncbi:MAG: cytochrome c3 family protein [Anaerolineales bacterium]